MQNGQFCGCPFILLIHAYVRLDTLSRAFDGFFSVWPPGLQSKISFFIFYLALLFQLCGLLSESFRLCHRLAWARSTLGSASVPRLSGRSNSGANGPAAYVFWGMRDLHGTVFEMYAGCVQAGLLRRCGHRHPRCGLLRIGPRFFLSWGGRLPASGWPLYLRFAHKYIASTPRLF